MPAALRACAMCHVVPESVLENKLLELALEHNAFGKRLRELGAETADRKTPLHVERLTAVADEDSDGDTASNEVELLGGTFPGDGASNPSAEPLADARKRHQEAFPGRYLWRPWQAVRRPDVPSAAGEWSDNPIDSFVSAEHARRGVTPRPLAEKGVLLRRLYLDLIGLPPQPEDLRAFLADQWADAWQRVVDRLTESPQYGQRWGRHFMDAWRYSDWAGCGAQVRDSRPHIWQRRDWIVESFNADKPFDRMMLEMLAAEKPEDANFQAAFEKAVKAAEEADKALETADEALRKSEPEAAAPPSTEYQKRALPSYFERAPAGGWHWPAGLPMRGTGPRPEWRSITCGCGSLASR